jgi:hypothetical protein
MYKRQYQSLIVRTKIRNKVKDIIKGHGQRTSWKIDLIEFFMKISNINTQRQQRNGSQEKCAEILYGNADRNSNSSTNCI